MTEEEGYMSTNKEQAASYAIPPSKKEQSRRIDQATLTPIKMPKKMQRHYFYSCNTSSRAKHLGLGQISLKVGIVWAS
jgi:hypothetical protein